MMNDARGCGQCGCEEAVANVLYVGQNYTLCRLCDVTRSYVIRAKTLKIIGMMTVPYKVTDNPQLKSCGSIEASVYEWHLYPMMTIRN